MRKTQVFEIQYDKNVRTVRSPLSKRASSDYTDEKLLFRLFRCLSHFVRFGTIKIYSDLYIVDYLYLQAPLTRALIRSTKMWLYIAQYCSQ